MRKLLILVLFVDAFISGFETKAQYIPHKLTLGFGGDAQLPVSSEIKNQALTTFGNYGLAPGFNTFVEFKVSNKLWLGFDYSESYFTKKDENVVIPISKNPSSNFIRYSMRGTYFLSTIASSRWKPSIVGIIGLANHTLTIEDPLRGLTEFPETLDKLSYQESAFSSSLGFIMTYTLNYDFDMYASVSYCFMSADNLLYQDHSFQSVALNIGLKLKFLKNKKILYE